MIVLAALLIAGQPAQPAGAVVEQKPKVLVLDFQDQGVGKNAVQIIHDTLVSHVSQNDKLDVISSEDMRRALDVDAQKRALGNCSDESCLAEIAGALGAQLLLYGTAGKLGDLVVINVSLFDARAQKSVGRETVEAKTLEEVPDEVRAAGDKLIARLPGMTESGGGDGGLGVVSWTGIGALAVGVGTGAVAGIVALANSPSPADGRTFAEKEAALPARNLSAGIAAVGAVVAVVGAGVLAAGLVVE